MKQPVKEESVPKPKRDRRKEQKKTKKRRKPSLTLKEKRKRKKLADDQSIPTLPGYKDVSSNSQDQLRIPKKSKRNKYLLLAHPELKPLLEKTGVVQQIDQVVKESKKTKKSKEPKEAENIKKKKKSTKAPLVQEDSDDCPELVSVEPLQVERKEPHAKKQSKKKENARSASPKNVVTEPPQKKRKQVEQNDSSEDISEEDSYEVVSDDFSEDDDDEDSDEDAADSPSVSAAKKSTKAKVPGPPIDRSSALKKKMTEKLLGARFRYINEQLYSCSGDEALQLFHNEPDSYQVYHEGYKIQVEKWPYNPLNRIINWLSKKSSDLVIADFGCGEARLAQSIPQTVHSFDLVALNENVVACDMANIPLEDGCVDIVIFCLSLMGTNISDFIREANRVLKRGGVMKIAEVSSRFGKVGAFVTKVEKIGFECGRKDVSDKMFYYFDFEKVADCEKSVLPTISLEACVYKKR